MSRKNGAPTASILRLLLGSALLALGAGAVLLGSSLSSGRERIAGPNQPVNAGATDLRDISGNNSPSVVANPTRAANLAVANRIDTPSFSCALNVSFDSGATWAPTPVPFPEGEEKPPRCFAPDVAFGPEGNLYMSFVTLIGLGNTPNAVWITSSTDGGRTLSTPVKASGPRAFQVRLLADPHTRGRLYLSWLQAASTANLALPEPNNPIVMSRSDDGGRTWAAPVTVSSDRPRVLAASTAIGGGGRLYLLYLDIGDDRFDYERADQGQNPDPWPGKFSLILVRSSDSGATWEEEKVIATDIVPTERFLAFLPPFPSLAVDGRHGDRVYAAFTDGRTGDADVRLWTSGDGGEHFSGMRVNDTPPHDGRSQYLPKLAVAPGGRLDVVYYDRRRDPANVNNEVSLQSSGDGGKTFGPRVRLSDRPFDSRVGFGSERNLPDLGSRLGLVSTDSKALAVWTDTRSGTQASNKQDLARAIVDIEEKSSLRLPLLLAGPAIALVGAVLLVTGALARRQPDH